MQRCLERFMVQFAYRLMPLFFAALACRPPVMPLAYSRLGGVVLVVLRGIP